MFKISTDMFEISIEMLDTSTEMLEILTELMRFEPIWSRLLPKFEILTTRIILRNFLLKRRKKNRD